MSRSPVPMLSALWISQYIGVGFFFVALSGILREEGVSLERIAIIQALGAAWALKFLWAPFLDRYSPPGRGHFRMWVLVIQPLIAVAILLLLPLDVVSDLGTVLLIVGVVVFLSATQDIATDALAVRLLRPDQRGVANGVQVAAGFIGNILGGGAVLIVYDAAGWAPAMIVLAVLTLAPLPLVLGFREPVPDGARPSLGVAFRALGGVLRRPGAARWSLTVVPLFYAGVTGAWALLTPALVDAGWSLTRIGTVLNIVGSVFAIVGALAAGVLVKASGRRAGMVVAGAVSAVTTLVLIPVVTAEGPDLLLGAGVIGAFVLGYSAVNTVVSTVHMDLSRETTAGTDYTALQSLAFVASFLVGGVVVALADTLGYTVMFAVCAVLVLGGLAIGIGSQALRAGDAAPSTGPPSPEAPADVPAGMQ